MPILAYATVTSPWPTGKNLGAWEDSSLNLGAVLLVVGGSIVVIGAAIYFRSILHNPAKIKAAVNKDIEGGGWGGGIYTSAEIRQLLLLNILGALLISTGFVTVLTGVLVQQQSAARPLEERISKLTSSLQESAKAVDEAQMEIEARQRLVDRLRSEQQTFEQLRRVDKPTADAIAATLQGELAESERRARVATWLLLPAWGAVLGLLFALVAEKLRKRPGY